MSTSIVEYTTAQLALLAISHWAVELDPEIDRVAAGDRSASNYPRLDLDRSSRLDSIWARIDRLDRLIRLK